MRAIELNAACEVSGGDNPGMGPYIAPTAVSLCLNLGSNPLLKGELLLCVTLYL